MHTTTWLSLVNHAIIYVVPFTTTNIKDARKLQRLQTSTEYATHIKSKKCFNVFFPCRFDRRPVNICGPRHAYETLILCCADDGAK